MRKAQTEVDGQSAKRYETTPARYNARTEPRSLEKCSHGDRPRKGIRSEKVKTGKQMFVFERVSKKINCK